MFHGPTPLLLPCRVGSKRGLISILPKYWTSEHEFWKVLCMHLCVWWLCGRMGLNKVCVYWLVCSEASQLTTFGCRKEDTFTEASACQDGHLMRILKEFHEILAHLSGYVEVWSEVLACFSFCTETHTWPHVLHTDTTCDRWNAISWKICAIEGSGEAPEKPGGIACKKRSRFYLGRNVRRSLSYRGANNLRTCELTPHQCPPGSSLGTPTTGHLYRRGYCNCK